MAQLGFLINSAQCSGCKACELACKDVHNFEIGPRARRVREVCGGGWSIDEKTGVAKPQGVFTYSVSFSCGHCMNPACVEACPTGAHHKDEETGLVLIDQDQCIVELRAEFGDCADVAPLPSSAETAPNVVIVAHRNAKTNEGDVRILSLGQ